MQALSEYIYENSFHKREIKADKSSLISLQEKLIVNKDYKSNDSVALKSFIADNVDLSYAYIMRTSNSILLGERIFNMFRRIWSNGSGNSEWQLIKSNHIDTEVRELTKNFNKYYEVYKFSITDSAPDKKAGTYDLFRNLKDEGFKIVDLAEKLNNHICIRYVLFDDVIIFQYGRYRNKDTFESYTTLIAWKGKLKKI